MKHLRIPAIAMFFFSLLLVFRFTESPRENLLSERSLERIVGLSDTSLANTSACATLAIQGSDWVLSNNCGGKPDQTYCILCLNDRTTKVPNTTGGPGITYGYRTAVCQNYQLKSGVCLGGSCEDMNIDGMCFNQKNTQPPVYDQQ